MASTTLSVSPQDEATNLRNAMAAAIAALTNGLGTAASAAPQPTPTVGGAHDTTPIDAKTFNGLILSADMYPTLRDGYNKGFMGGKDPYTFVSSFLPAGQVLNGMNRLQAISAAEAAMVKAHPDAYAPPKPAPKP